MARDRLQIQLRIKSALSERDTRVACLISESMRNVLDLLDEQPPAVLEAMIDVAREKIRNGTYLPHRRSVADVMFKYMEQALKEARAREHRLLHAITGEGVADDV